jgi:hypothetical protein
MKTSPKTAPARLAGALLVAMFALTGIESASMAQTGATKEAIRPPRANKADDPNLFINIVGLVIITGAVLGASVIPSRRGHQD